MLVVYSSLAALVVLLAILVLRRSNSKLPPGPKGHWLFGNAFQVPLRNPWEWFQTVGIQLNSEIISLDMFGKPMIVVNSQAAADELFGRRSTNFADRPTFPMINDLMGFDWNIAFMKYGERWKARRAIFRKTFQPPAIYDYKPNIERGARTLLKLLFEKPEDFPRWIRHSIGVIILSSTHGIDVRMDHDPYMDAAEKSTDALSHAITPGAFLVDSIPLLKYVPDWFPGAGFKIKAKEWKKAATRAPQITFDYAKGEIERGTNKPSVVSRYLKDLEENGTWSKEQEDAVRDASGVMVFAGTESAASSISTFLLAMVLHPEKQKKAQEAIDVAIGQERLPDFSDEGKIPYIEALSREVLRWRPVAPTGVPHYTNKPDHYQGYYIPANCLVIGNSWAILHDSAVYGADADDFNPDRFMTNGELNKDMPDVKATFGFGRRACAGQYMAELSLFMIAASILAVFDIKKPLDENGNEITPSDQYETGGILHPTPFKCRIIPRNDKAATLL
ncbi:hypothetical protein D9758_016236 [Tetrapyrgos nigripes]|uniref:Cytochrome P450 n=1 Tax=Tetrapyrgos nigripes TaxID=182062 RepID=A0A8H5C5T4_9AGAR|nr:hypothetical protein D9758_016236 [Tetrapyrgos nigripes]